MRQTRHLARRVLLFHQLPKRTREAVPETAPRQPQVDLRQNRIHLSPSLLTPPEPNLLLAHTWYERDVMPKWVWFDDEGGGWERFSRQQIVAAKGVLRSLVEQYPEIRDVVGHDQVSQGRKSDPGPAFPLDILRHEIFGEDAPATTNTTGDDLEEGRRSGTEPSFESVYFEAKDGELSEDARELLRQHARRLAAHHDVKLVLQGNTDERGTNEENLAWAQSYASQVADFLISQGIEPSRLLTLSYGEERPSCVESSEECWRQNRRVDFILRR